MRRGEGRELLEILSPLLPGPVAVCGPDGVALWESGEVPEGEEETPIVAGEVTVGHVRGAAGRDAVAHMVALLLDIEGQKKDLVNEALLRYKELNLLYGFAGRVAGRLHTSTEVAELMIERAQGVIEGQRFVVLLADAASGRLEHLSSMGFVEEPQPGDPVFAAAAEVMASGKSLLVPADEPGCAARMVVPIKFQESPIGVLAICSKTQHEYHSDEIKIASALALMGAMAIEKARYIEVMFRFVPSEFLDFLGTPSIPAMRLGDQAEHDMSVMFCDIRAFTTLTETMTPTEAFSFINEFLGYVGPVVRAHGGFVDKYLGDAIMAIFPTRADDAVRCGVELQRAIARFNDDRFERWGTRVRAGVGVHTGRLMLGIIGERERWSGTVISDAVNVAARVEGLTKEYGANVLVTGATLGRLEDPGQFSVRRLGSVQVKGKSEQVSIHEVFDADAAEIRASKLAQVEVFESAVAAAAEKRYAEAIAALEGVCEAIPEDGVALRSLTRMRLAQDYDSAAPDDTAEH